MRAMLTVRETKREKDDVIEFAGREGKRERASDRASFFEGAAFVLCYSRGARSLSL